MSDKKSLYLFKKEYLELEAEFIALDDVPQDELEDAKTELTKRYHKWEGEILKKLDACAAMIRMAELREEGARAEAKRLTERAKTFAKRQEFIKRLVLETMKTIGTESVESECFTIGRYRGRKRAVCKNNKAQLPDALLRFPKPEPDKMAIKARLESGGKVGGWELEEGPESLRIK
jgi:hypothetical protein